MKIIHHIADKNINNSYSLDRMSKKAIKMIRNLLPPVAFNFQDFKIVTTRLVDKLKRLMLRKLITVYEKQHLVHQIYA